jgi:putative nucleotidyltransferase with HDIG domain
MGRARLEMIPIYINEFISGSKLPVDIFIKLSDEKFIQVARAGESVQIDRLTNYKNKRVDYLYIRDIDYSNYVNQEVFVAEILIEKSKLPKETHTSVLRKAAESVIQEIEQMGFNKNTFEHAKRIANATLTLVQSQGELCALLKALHKHSNHLYTHSVAVGAISCMIGEGLGWQKPVTLEKLSLGGFLHDIGKKELPEELNQKSRAAMSFNELMLYESHPFRGMEILQSINVVPDDVISIVFEHHENNIGQGFPRRLRSFKIHPLARVTALANVFAELTLKHPNYLQPKGPIDAFRYIEKTMGRPFDKEVFNALRKVLLGEDEEKVA